MKQEITNGTFTATVSYNFGILSYSVFKYKQYVADVWSDKCEFYVRISLDDMQPLADIVRKCGREFLNQQNEE